MNQNSSSASVSSSSSSTSSSRNGKRSSHGTIESSVTRLLVSTKHLLESLTQWARQEADDKFVSDAYVRLGNDFRAATRAFNNAGVDISDIGDVPQALRIILEAALSEAPSQENLDRFLPNIRNIIVTLLQNLKSKQSKGRSVNPGKQDVKSVRDEKHELIPAEKTPRVSHELKKEFEPGVVSSEENDALRQLQKSSFLQRRASKRFSAYQYAKLANYSPNASLPTVSSPNRSSEKGNISNDNDYRLSNLSTSHPENLDHEVDERNQLQKEVHIFLKLNELTKKATIRLPVTFASLRLLFVEKFAYSPGTASFPDIYIKDQASGEFYQLEEQFLESDIKQGSLLTLKEVDDRTNNGIEIMDLIKNLSKKVDLNYQSLTNDFQSLLKSTEELKNIPPLKEPTKTKQDPSSENSSLSKDTINEITRVKSEIKLAKQLQMSNTRTFKHFVTELLPKVKQIHDNSLSISKSSNRDYMESCHLRLSEESDVLLTKVDDLQDILEALRKDVVSRGVRIGEKQLKSTYKEINEAKTSLDKMSNYIGKEKSVWKKIWEAELDKVCEEQQFFNLQDDLTRDLDEDLKKIEETYRLISQCSSEQLKQSAHKRNRFVAQLHIPEPGESLHEIKDAVLSEVAALRPNHETRLEAIARAERMREREREIMLTSKFQEELGDYVEDSKSKRVEGIEEIERIRQQKDNENLKSSFGII